MMLIRPLLALLALATACGNSTSIALTPKDRAPVRPSAEALALETTDHRGRDVDLARLAREKTMVVIFYRGHW